MVKRNQTQQQVQDEADELKSRLAETEETLRAIQEYMVDAFVVNREHGIQVVTLNESEIPYRMMVESMNEGAVTLIPDGTIFYCNGRLGEMLQVDCEKLVGTSFHDLIAPEEQRRFEALFQQTVSGSVREEFTLQTVKGNRVPVQLSMYPLGEGRASGIAVLATDITERIQSEEKIRSLAAELTRVEQEERHRISQVLHDDLQQRLFAIKAQLSFLKDVNLSAENYRELDQVQATLSESIAITRNLSIDLSPIVLQGEGLTEVLTWLAFRMKEQYGLQVDLETKKKLYQIDSHLRMLLFQSIRELLFNVVKHADISQAKVMLDERNGRPCIVVSDDGKGFDSETVMGDPQAAHGLLIIKDRLNLLGCSMKLTSKPGEGTRIEIELPVERKLN
ncbi:MAG TPA: PAS domain S-box protein [Anaerolineales bacterium]|jgi:two-component system CheB/CheR fusion protein|nr:PAS domain S-box protein [Anaerolineales bacterium]